MYVIKRDGRLEPWNFEKIAARLKRLTYRLSNEHCDPILVTLKVSGVVYSGVTTTQIDELAAETAASMIENHPDYDMLAARISASTLHKNTEKSFSKTIKLLYENGDKRSGTMAPPISDCVYEMVMKNATRLDSEIIYDRDFNYDYIGFKTLEKSHLLKIDGKVVERPQDMMMRVAVGMHHNNIDSAITAYRSMSQNCFEEVSKLVHTMNDVDIQ